jgi:integrase
VLANSEKYLGFLNTVEIYKILNSRGDNKEDYDFSDFNYQITLAISFFDDYWDFNSEKQPEYPSYKYRFDYKSISPFIKNYYKLFVLRQITKRKNRIPTVNNDFLHVKAFDDFLQSNMIVSLKQISWETIESYIDSLDLNEKTKVAYRKSIGLLLNEISNKNPHINYHEIFDWIEEERENAKEKVKAIAISGKTKYIPPRIYYKIVSIAIRDIMSTNTTIFEKTSACLVILLGETGMRIGECRLLEVSRMFPIKVEGFDLPQWTLDFWTYKIEKKWTTVVLTELAKFAMDTLTDLHQTYRGSTKYLLVTQKGEPYKDTSSLIRKVKNFLFKHQNEILDDIEAKELNKFEYLIVKKCHAEYYTDLSDKIDKKVYYVNAHQFRVTCATILAKTYPLQWISRYMNHMMPEMTEHYIREEVMLEDSLKNAELIEETLRQRASETGQSLETDYSKISDNEIALEMSDEEYIQAYHTINEFIRKNKYNIFDNVKEIISKVSMVKLPLMETELGFCANAINFLCQRQKYLKLIREYSDLPNIHLPNLSTMHITYSRFKEKVEVLSYNYKNQKKNKNYKSVYITEKKEFSDLVNTLLIPEIKLVKTELELKGEKVILNKYPKLKEIVKEVSNIEKEIQKWI